MVDSIGPVKTTDHYTEALQLANQTSHFQRVSGRPERPHCVLSITAHNGVKGDEFVFVERKTARYKAPSVCGIGSMTTIGHVFIPLDREHDGVVPRGEDRAHFESLPVPLALWQSFEECLSDHLSELSEGQIDRDEKFWFEAAHVNAMIAVVEAEAVAAAPELRDWLISLVAFARRAADRQVGVVFVIS